MRHEFVGAKFGWRPKPFGAIAGNFQPCLNILRCVTELFQQWRIDLTLNDGATTFNGSGCALQRLQFGSFNVELDEIAPGKVQPIQSDGFNMSLSVLANETGADVANLFNVHAQPGVFKPQGTVVPNRTRTITRQAMDIFLVGFKGINETARPNSLQVSRRVIAQRGPAVHHH